MKIWGVVFFILALAWTWNVIHSTPSVSFETHAGIQDKMASLILTEVQRKRPTATDVRVKNIWTELMSPGKVKAHFSYSFKDKSSEGKITDSTIQGEGILERQSGDTTGNERWTLTQVKTNSDNIVFTDNLVINPDGSNQ